MIYIYLTTCIQFTNNLVTCVKCPIIFVTTSTFYRFEIKLIISPIYLLIFNFNNSKRLVIITSSKSNGTFSKTRRDRSNSLLLSSNITISPTFPKNNHRSAANSSRLEPIPSRTMSGIIIGVDEQHAAKIHSLRVRSTRHRFERHSILGGDTSARDESRQKLTSPSLTIETSNDTR